MLKGTSALFPTRARSCAHGCRPCYFGVIVLSFSFSLIQRLAEHIVCVAHILPTSFCLFISSRSLNETPATSVKTLASSSARSSGIIFCCNSRWHECLCSFSKCSSSLLIDKEDTDYNTQKRTFPQAACRLAEGTDGKQGPKHEDCAGSDVCPKE